MLQPINRLKDYVMCALALGAGPRAKWSILSRETKNIRVRLNLGAYHPNEVYSLQTIYGPLYFRDNFGDITNLVSLFYHQVYRLRGLSQEGVILDVGANIGLAARWFAHHNAGRPIYCFEPLAASVALIGLNCPSANVEQVAVGARHGRVKLRVDRDGVMASQIPCEWETEEVDLSLISLDEFTNAHAVEKVALIKIDTEGMEVEILRGATETLKKTAQLVIETHNPSLHDEAIGHLRREGFYVDTETFHGTTGLVFASRRSEGVGMDGRATWASLETSPAAIRATNRERLGERI